LKKKRGGGKENFPSYNSFRGRQGGKKAKGARAKKRERGGGGLFRKAGEKVGAEKKKGKKGKKRGSRQGNYER